MDLTTNVSHTVLSLLDDTINFVVFYVRYEGKYYSLYTVPNTSSSYAISGNVQLLYEIKRGTLNEFYITLNVSCTLASIWYFT